MMPTVSFAASGLKSTQTTWAPSRANSVAVALPFPQPGPTEPAPKMIAILSCKRPGMINSIRWLILRTGRRGGRPIQPDLAKLACCRLKQRPGFLAVSLLPFAVEAGGDELVAERVVVDLVEFEAAFLQFRLQRGVHVFHLGALTNRLFVDVALDDLAQVRGNTVPHALVRENPESVPHVVGQRAVLLDLVHLVNEQADKRLLEAIGDAGLHRGVGFRPGDRDRGRAERLEHRGPWRARWDTNLEAVEIIRRENWLGGRRHLAKT